jgi:zona occludens toxin (predicted ATPase)
VIFQYTGLPRSGKSYTAVKDAIVPALIEGRPVVAFVNGLDRDALSALVGRELTEHDLLTFPHADGRQVLDMEIHNSLIVLDEIHRLWPAGRKLSEAEIAYFSEHGQYGNDICGIAQDFRSLHVEVRRKVEWYARFQKLSALGLAGAYGYSRFQNTGTETKEQWTLVKRGFGRYRQKYYSLYSSYQDGAIGGDTYDAKGASLWRTPMFRYGAPVFAALGWWAGSYVVDLFDPSESELIASETAPQAPDRQPKAREQHHESPNPAVAYLLDRLGAGRLRLAELPTNRGKPTMLVQVVENGAIAETFSQEELITMGARVARTSYGLVIRVEQASYIARRFPLQQQYRPDFARLTGPLAGD